MVFPRDEKNEIDTRIIMVTDVIFRGIDKAKQVNKHYNLASIILVDIYHLWLYARTGFHLSKGATFVDD